jgi:hypothetical protein
MKILLAIIVTGIILFLITLAFDYFRGEKLSGVGQITEKQFVKAHVTTVPRYDAGLKMTVMDTRYHPDSWHVFVDIDNKGGPIEVSEDFYNSLEIDVLVWVVYRVGKISGHIYIMSIGDIEEAE